MILDDLLLSSAVLFSIIVLHELGHFLMARAYGWETHFSISNYGPAIRTVKKNAQIRNGQDLKKLLLEHIAISQGGFLGLLAPVLGMFLFPSIAVTCIVLTAFFTSYSIYESSTMCISSLRLEKIVELEIRE